MSISEFDLIGQYFKNNVALVDNDVCVGIGDDCAILDVPDGFQLAVSTDTLVSDVHFFADVDPFRLGYKALAVNLSDLAAMGATPKWVSLAITLPEVNEQWLAEFSRGFFTLANQHRVSLIGGDTTHGPLSITISVKGIVPRGQALLRNKASVGELICVSGNLGDGALGLDAKQLKCALSSPELFIDALEITQPRIELGLVLRSLASSCIDISDGLIQDLQHILQASHCSANVHIDKLPFSPAMRNEINMGAINCQQASQYALTGGDDYELLFTIASEKLPQLTMQMQKAEMHDITVKVIGEITEPTSPQVALFENNKSVSFMTQGWDHFK
ncbi:thiamine-phosphate kinase [Psychromonas sp. MME2]|uniref:thiamine-phosphate kinase n=1 Tax=unclassified Psychromonas TaxID=2614957 RepID=UPI00339BA636